MVFGFYPREGDYPVEGNPLSRQIREFRTSRNVCRCVSRLTGSGVFPDPRCWRLFPEIGTLRGGTAHCLAAPCGAASQGFRLVWPDNAYKFKAMLPILLGGEMFGEDVSWIIRFRCLEQLDNRLSNKMLNKQVAKLNMSRLLRNAESSCHRLACI